MTYGSRVGKGEFDSVDFQFTPKPLTEPYVNLSTHTALIMQLLG